MNTAEFNQWYADLCVHFPAINAFIQRQQDPGKTLATWATSLADVELADAKEATARIHRGDEEPIGSYDSELQNVPRIVRSIAKRLHATRNTCPPPRPSERRTGRQGVETHLGAMLREVRRLVESGSDSKAAAAQVNSRYPAIPETMAPRYRCPDCWDTLYVTIYSGKAVALMRRLEFPGWDDNELPAAAERPPYLTCSIFCRCLAAARLRLVRPRFDDLGNPLDEPIRYDPNLHASCQDGDPYCRENMQRLEELVERQTRGEPVTPEFAAFNRGEL